jgi:hypothetical protein
MHQDIHNSFWVAALAASTGKKKQSRMTLTKQTTPNNSNHNNHNSSIPIISANNNHKKDGAMDMITDSCNRNTTFSNSTHITITSTNKLVNKNGVQQKKQQQCVFSNFTDRCTIKKFDRFYVHSCSFL